MIIFATMLQIKRPHKILIQKGLVIILFFLSGFTYTQEGWELFASVKFKSKYIKEYNEKFLVPEFDSKIRNLAGTKVKLKGHYMPFDFKDNTIILSKFPYSSCFFCGGAGPESVAEIQLSNKPGKLKADQVIIVEGNLQLNDQDVNHMNFILTNAEIVNSNK